MREREELFELSKLISFFANKSKGNLYRTKLNKLLFYAQFLYLKEYKGEMLLHYNFVKDYHGPVLEDMDKLLVFLKSASIIELYETKYGLTIKPKFELEESLYTSRELKILNKVQEKFKDYTASEISEYSHKEKLWANTELKQVIDVNRANELNEFIV